jgi:hypothetical protein
VIRQLCFGKDFDSSPVGTASLKGFSALVELDAIKWVA